MLEDLWSSLEVHPTHCMRGVYLDQFLVCLFQRIFSVSYYGLLGTLAFTLTLSSFWQGRYYRCASKFMREAINLIKVFALKHKIDTGFCCHSGQLTLNIQDFRIWSPKSSIKDAMVRVLF